MYIMYIHSIYTIKHGNTMKYDDIRASVAACVSAWMGGWQCMLAHVNLGVNRKWCRCGNNQNQPTCKMYQNVWLYNQQKSQIRQISWAFVGMWSKLQENGGHVHQKLGETSVDLITEIPSARKGIKGWGRHGIRPQAGTAPNKPVCAKQLVLREVQHFQVSKRTEEGILPNVDTTSPELFEGFVSFSGHVAMCAFHLIRRNDLACLTACIPLSPVWLVAAHAGNWPTTSQIIRYPYSCRFLFVNPNLLGLPFSHTPGPSLHFGLSWLGSSRFRGKKHAGNLCENCIGITIWPRISFQESSHLPLPQFATSPRLTHLSGRWFQPLWKIWVRQWEGWHPIYDMENKSHVPKHQPVIEWKQLLQFHQVILREVQHFQVALRCCRAPGQGLEPIAGLAISRWAEMVSCLLSPDGNSKYPLVNCPIPMEHHHSLWENSTINDDLP